jgi:hypothetical protein
VQQIVCFANRFNRRASLMKALSLPRPYAWALLTGHIGVYRQTGLPVHTGRLLIHVGAEAPRATTQAVLHQVADRSGTDMALLHQAYDRQSPAQAIIGGVTVTGIAWNFSASSEPVSWNIAHARRAGVPVPCSGACGFFDVPGAVLDGLAIPGYLER